MVLLVDNYDSFTYNLLGYLLQLEVDCQVIRNDEYPLPTIIKMEPEALVFSPGPKQPQDGGIMMELIDHFCCRIPILGICLGHQAIGEYFGAKLIKAKVPMHGRTSSVTLNENPLFDGLPKEIEVMRYHSLILTDVNNKELEVIAETTSKEVMAISHRSLPIYGLQFHPESILTEKGFTLLSNWIDINNLSNKFRGGK